jgi:signal transduction histidine kinase
VELKPGVKGIGLGLAIVKNIIKLHKGEIWVESNGLKGSTFNILIPLTQK